MLIATILTTLLHAAKPHNLARTASALQLKPPQIIFLEQPFGWVPIAVGFIQFLLLAGLTYYIFRRNYRQKIMERQAAWYHDVVVDFAIANILRSAEEMVQRLCSLAGQIEGLKAKNQPLATIEQTIRENLGSFKESVHRLLNALSARLVVVDKKLEQTVANRLMKLEDEVTEWFSKEAQSPLGASRSGLPDIVLDCQSDCLQTLREYEFLHWG